MPSAVWWMLAYFVMGNLTVIAASLLDGNMIDDAAEAALLAFMWPLFLPMVLFQAWYKVLLWLVNKR